MQAQEEEEAVAAGELPPGSNYHRNAYLSARAQLMQQQQQHGGGHAEQQLHPQAPPQPHAQAQHAGSRHYAPAAVAAPAAHHVRPSSSAAPPLASARPDGSGGVILEGYAALAAAGMLDDGDEADEEGEGSDEEGAGGPGGDGGGAAMDAWEAMDPASLRAIADRLAQEMVAAREQRMRAMGLPVPHGAAAAAAAAPRGGAPVATTGTPSQRVAPPDAHLLRTYSNGSAGLASPDTEEVAAGEAGGLPRAPSRFAVSAPAPAAAAATDAVQQQQQRPRRV